MVIRGIGSRHLAVIGKVDGKLKLQLRPTRPENFLAAAAMTNGLEALDVAFYCGK